MKREQIIKSLVNQFAENIANLSDETLQDVKSGKLVISLTPAVDNEAGGRDGMLGDTKADIRVRSTSPAAAHGAKLVRTRF